MGCWWGYGNRLFHGLYLTADLARNTTRDKAVMFHSEPFRTRKMNGRVLSEIHHLQPLGGHHDMVPQRATGGVSRGDGAAVELWPCSRCSCNPGVKLSCPVPSLVGSLTIAKISNLPPFATDRRCSPFPWVHETASKVSMGLVAKMGTTDISTYTPVKGGIPAFAVGGEAIHVQLVILSVPVSYPKGPSSRLVPRGDTVGYHAPARATSLRILELRATLRSPRGV